MGTRAAFYVGNPIDGGRLLGCIAWDGYPDGDCQELAKAVSEEEFEQLVSALAASRNDFTPASDGFPFPWVDNLFLTDWVYAFFDGKTRATYGKGWATIPEILAADEEEGVFEGQQELPLTPVNVPRSEPGKGKDSIMIFSVGGSGIKE